MADKPKTKLTSTGQTISIVCMIVFLGAAMAVQRAMGYSGVLPGALFGGLGGGLGGMLGYGIATLTGNVQKGE